MSSLTAFNVIKDLKRLGNPTKAKTSAWFFKTGKGQYGYGDLFLGVTVPKERRVAKKYKSLPLPEIGKLLRNKFHECRLTGLLILVEQYKTANELQRARIARFYLSSTRYINNWDLVDLTAPSILGHYLLKRDRAILYRFAQSKNLWERRIAIISAYTFIRNGEYSDTLKLAEVLINDKHDLIHKAVGWMLREVGKKSLLAEERFLKKHAARLPRTALRYAIEKFPEKKRKAYLALPT